MTDDEIIDLIADYLHGYVTNRECSDGMKATYGRTCYDCRENATKLLWMVDAYRKVEAV